MRVVVKQDASATLTNLTDLGFSFEGTVVLDSVGTPAHGSLTDHGDGSFTYTPDSGYLGSDAIPYTLKNGLNNLFPRTISVMVLSDSDYPVMEAGDVRVGSAGWTTVSLENNFGSEMIVVATPVVPAGEVSVVTRIRNAAGNSFDIKVQRVDGLTTEVPDIQIQYMVAKEGVYHPDTHGMRLRVGK